MIEYSFNDGEALTFVFAWELLLVPLLEQELNAIAKASTAKLIFALEIIEAPLFEVSR